MKSIFLFDQMFNSLFKVDDSLYYIYYIYTHTVFLKVIWNKFTRFVPERMAAAENGELNEQELSELDKLQLTINQKSDETLECTRRMREMCAEAKVNFIKK